VSSDRRSRVPLRLALALAACGLLLGGGCRRKPPSEQAPSEQPAPEAAASAPAEGPRAKASAAPRSEPAGTLRSRDVRNLELLLNGESVKLQDGVYEDARHIVRLLEPILRGDLDGDGRVDVVFVVSDQDLEAKQRPLYLYAALDRGGQPEPTPALQLPDHEKVRNLKLRDGEIRLELVVRRITDEPCCPSGRRTIVVRLDAGQLVEIG